MAPSLILKRLNLLDLVCPPCLHAKYTLHLVVLYSTSRTQCLILIHLLSYNLDDMPDIIRATKDLNRRANFVLCVFLSQTYLLRIILLNHSVCQCMVVHCGLCLVKIYVLLNVL